MTARDEFTTRTKQTLAKRAAHFCSNPFCRKLTAAPHSDITKSLTTGHAAHIHAARPDGPRFDPDQTREQRRHISNGIWLCRECGDLVDKDPAAHSAETLRRWREDHEALIAEVHTKGYASSIELLQSKRHEPAVAKQIVAVFEDRRLLWVPFDAEFPDRVRSSLDLIRMRLMNIYGALVPDDPLNQIVRSLTETVLIFYDRMEFIDYRTLRCDANDSDWIRFRDALAELRKSLGLQLANLVSAYKLQVTESLARILPLMLTDDRGRAK
jgi:hypothetical protein